MKITVFGISFPHAKGEFCIRSISNHYILCCFETPFLYERDGKLIPGEAGDILINTPGQVVYHGPRKDAEQGFVNDWFHILGENFGELLQRYPLPLNQAFSVGKELFLRDYARRIRQEFRSGNPGEEELISCILTELIIDLHRAYTQTTNRGLSNDSIDAIQKAIYQSPGNIWTLQDMAQRSGYSVSRFSELYTKRHGVSPINDVLRARISLAKRLLSSGQATVSQVAQLCGFRTVNYFSKYFKQCTGVSPSAYLKQYLNPIH